MSEDSQPHVPPPILVSIEVYDNRTGEMVVNEGFNTDRYDSVKRALDEAKATVDRRRGGMG